MYKKYAAVRDEKGMNDNAVARAAGIPASTLYDWKQRSAESDEAGIATFTLWKISKVLGVELTELL